MVIAFVYLYIVYLIQILLDALLLSVVGYILSKIVNIKLTYKSIFNISVYALTLSVILYMIYTVINLFTGFTIKFFEIAYNAISYIYILTAMLIMKSDLVKQQMEVGKIIEEQNKIKEEKTEENQPKEEDKKEEEPKENQPEEKNKKKEKPNRETTEGSEA